jgi:cell division protein FtsI/penicillin-binding protein 2
LRHRLTYDDLAKIRVKKLIFVLFAAYVLLIARLFYIQVVRAPFYREKARELTVRKIVLPARRGTIYDRNGEKLAVTIDACDIYVQPVKIKDKEGVATQLSKILGCSRSQILDTLNSGKKFTYIARRADIWIGDAVTHAKILGTGSLRTTKRVYPGGTLAAHIIGFTNVDGRGIEGLERVYDRQLHGTDGYVVAEVDARGKIIPGTRRDRVEPVDGGDIVLTVDSTLQRSLEHQLEMSYTAHAAAGASAVMMDPKTGEILALANMPTFDPNNAKSSSPASRRDRAVTDLYEPGSTLKSITACAGLESKAITPSDIFYCNRSMQIGRRVVHCSVHPPFMAGHGPSNVAKILKYSCNIGAADIGFKLGAARLYKFEEAFGFYEKPGSGLPGEVCGWHDNWKDWADIRLANIAFGQGINVTPLQMARAYCAIANGGLLMKPYVVKEVRKPDGKPEEQFVPTVARRVMSEDTSAMVAEMLQGVVSEGTGKTADVQGYRVCGKTGSAQKASAGGRGYAAGKFVASFAGFLPLNDPRIVMLVAVDEPKGTHWGATVAGPVFQGAATRAMWHLKVPPDNVPGAPRSTGGSKGNGHNSVESPVSRHPRLGG